MKKNLKILFIICVAFGAVFSGASSNYAQAVGGYKTIPVTDAAVIEAADVAVAAHNAKEEEIIYQLIAVKSAERQTVQGTNYRLCMQIVAEDAEFETDYQYVRAVIFRTLEGDFDLRSWTDVKNCGK
jgi:hypothetical protein